MLVRLRAVVELDGELASHRSPFEDGFEAHAQGNHAPGIMRLDFGRSLPLVPPGIATPFHGYAAAAVGAPTPIGSLHVETFAAEVTIPIPSEVVWVESVVVG